VLSVLCHSGLGRCTVRWMMRTKDGQGVPSPILIPRASYVAPRLSKENVLVAGHNASISCHVGSATDARIRWFFSELRLEIANGSALAAVGAGRRRPPGSRTFAHIRERSAG